MTTSFPFRATLKRFWIERRHTALLVVILLALVVRPLLGDTGAGPLIFSLALLLLLLMALLTIRVDELVGEREVLRVQQRHRSMIAWLLAVPAIIERVAMLLSPSPRLFLIGVVSWLLFFAFITWSELRTMLRHREVTGETISMSMSIYLLIGFTWGVFYAMLFQLDPTAFNLGPTAPAAAAESSAHVFPILVYFSLTTLSTVGFGDVTPLTLATRYAAVAEAITGQFYMAILVARLVGMHMSRAAPRPE